ncbi:MAG: cation transporter [Lachnospiraceae bacterium]|nr:cation transporter [Lachnospiraceae bacterium]
MDREKVIIRVSIQGIIMNLILVAFKAVVGLMANSIAIILDAVNNLSDAFSQVITIVGTKLSAKAPDKKHPYGYGRIEYLSSVIVAVLVLMAGITSLKESVEKVVHPSKAEYTKVSLIIIGVAVVVKFFFGSYTKKMGEKVQSQSLIASGTDAFMDSVLSLSTFVAALISMFAHITLEGILGVLLSVFIIKAGLEILLETLSSIIGDRTDRELSLAIKKEICGYSGVNGAYDLVLHDYGPSRSIGSVHIEVNETMNADEIYRLTRKIMADIYEKFSIGMTIGIYATNVTNPKIIEIRTSVYKIIKEEEHVLQMHGFYVDEERKSISFDLVVSYSAPSTAEVCKRVQDKVLKKYPEYRCDINIDHDFSD